MYDIKEIGMLPPPYGGVSVYLERLIENLSNEGYAVGAYYTETNDNLIKSSPLFDKWSWFETKYYPFKIFKYINQLRKYTILHSHMGLESMLYLWTLKVILKKKIVVTIHNSMVTNYYHSTNIINKIFLKLMLKSDVVWITVSDQARIQLLSLPIKLKNDIHVIPAYIPDMADPAPLSPDMQDYIDNHKKTIAFYGHSFMYNEGVDIYGFRTVIEVYKSLLSSGSDIGLIMCVADKSDIDALTELHKYAKEMLVDDKIYWQIGAINNMKGIWENVDVYFRPTSTDGDSVAVREALDAGAVVVASDVAPRPDGVHTYKFADVNDAVYKIQMALTIGKLQLSPNMEYYDKMKSLYMKLLRK